MDKCRIDIPQTPQVTETAEDEGGKGTQSISSSIRQTPEVTEKTEDEGGKTIHSSMLKRRKTISSSTLKCGKAIFSKLKSIVNRPGSSQPPEKANDQVGIPPQSNNVPPMCLPSNLYPCGSASIERDLLSLDRQCNFEELVKNMKDDTPKIRKWYGEVERRLNESNTELGRMMALYTDEDLGRMMARSGLFLLEFLRFLALPNLPRGSKDLRRLRRSSNGFFESRDPHWNWELLEALTRIDSRIPFFVLKKIFEWERDADKDENRLGSDGDADKDENRGCRWGCMQIKMKTGEGDADTDLDSILKHAWPELSPIKYDSHEIAGVQLKDDSHLLQFLYENIIGSSDFKHAYKWRKNKRRRDITLPQAEWLKGKGMKFAQNEGLLKNIRFDFRNGTLYLPAIEMDGKADAVLRNLVVFEASKQGKESQPLGSYVNLMQRLIDTADDVQALRDGGIIECHLGNNIYVADVWKGMCSNSGVDHVWKGMCELIDKKIKYEPIDKAIYDVNDFYTSKCRIKCRIMYTEFKQSYCSKPWIVLSVISACILFALTAFQTYLAWEQVRLQRESMPKT